MDPCLALLAALAVANTVGAILVVLDKRRARRSGRRTRERILWLWAALGGWPLMLAAMAAVRHKTRKPAFLGPFLAAALVATAWAAWAWTRLC